LVRNWTLYRDFRFEDGSDVLQPSDVATVSEIADYLKANPSLKVGLDGSVDPRGTNPRNQNLSDQRVTAIRNALIAAGVPSAKVQMGAFGDAQLIEDRRVALLVRTDN
jgi:outer membrane protein OmpA-like peptidoglycan-associated protein